MHFWKIPPKSVFICSLSSLSLDPKAATRFRLIPGVRMAFNVLRAPQLTQMVKNQPAIQATWVRGLTSGSRRSPGEGNGNPLQCSSLENSHGQKSLAGYSPWGHKESDTTE